LVLRSAKFYDKKKANAAMKRSNSRCKKQTTQKHVYNQNLQACALMLCQEKKCSETHSHREVYKIEPLLPMLWQQYQWVLIEILMFRVKKKNGRTSSTKF